MEHKVPALDGKETGKGDAVEGNFGLDPRPDLIQRCVNWQLAKRQRGTHKTKGRAEVYRTSKKMYAQKGTGGARHGSARARSSAAAAALSARSCAATPSICRRRCARSRCGTRCPPRPRTAASSWSTRRASKEAKTKALAEQFGKLGIDNALIVDGAEIDNNFKLRRAQHPEHRRAAGAGHQRLRHPAAQDLVLTKAAVDALEARFK